MENEKMALNHEAENQEKMLENFNFEVLEPRLELSRWFTKSHGGPAGSNSGSVGLRF